MVTNAALASGENSVPFEEGTRGGQGHTYVTLGDAAPFHAIRSPNLICRASENPYSK